MNRREQDNATLDSTLDVVVVGGGPVGLACGIEAQRAGYHHLVLEKGCLADSVFQFPKNMLFFTTPELMEIGQHPLITSHGKPTRTEALDYYRSVARVEGLAIHTYEEVVKVAAQDGRTGNGSFRIDTRGREGERTYGARRVVLATGYYDNPNYLGVPGEDLPHVSHYYTEAHSFGGQKVMVVGGKNSACETALDLYRHDADVTLVHRGKEFGESVKYWVRPDIENRVAAGGIRALFETTVVAIRERSVLLSRDGGEFEEPFDQVFLLTGYHPDDAFLRRCGLRPDPKSLRVSVDPDTLESKDVPGIFLAGSVSAGHETGMIFIENGRYDAEKIFAYLAKVAGR